MKTNERSEGSGATHEAIQELFDTIYEKFCDYYHDDGSNEAESRNNLVELIAAFCNEPKLKPIVHHQEWIEWLYVSGPFPENGKMVWIYENEEIQLCKWSDEIKRFANLNGITHWQYAELPRVPFTPPSIKQIR